MKKDQIKKNARNQIKRNNEDYIANRVMVVFAAAIVMLWGLSYLWRGYNIGATFMAALRATDILIWVAAAGLIGSCVWAVLDIKKGTFKKESIVNGIMFAAFFAVLLASVLLVKFDHNLAGRVLYVIIPGIAILHLIFSSYQREFFWFSLTCSVVLCMIWIMAKAPHSRSAMLAVILALCACAAAVLAYLSARKNGGVLAAGKLSIRICEVNSLSAAAVCAVYGAAALMAVVAYASGAPYAYYALYALAGVFAAAAVYYTVKLI